MKIIVSFLRELIFILYPIGCLILFSILYPFVWLDFKVSGGK